MDLTGLPDPPPTALVANLPYNVSVPVLLHLLDAFPSLRHGLVLVQAEVADRLAAPPGSRTYGVPSVKAAWYADVTRAGAVSRSVFWPVPNVDSTLVRFVRHPAPTLPPGLTRTDASGMMFEQETYLNRYTEQTPLGKCGGEPEDIAHAARFLAGPGAAWITGHTLVVDGGAMAGASPITTRGG